MTARAGMLATLQAGPASAVALEVLHFTLVLLSLVSRTECAQVAALACLGIDLSRIESVFSGGEFSDHRRLHLIEKRPI